MLQASPDHFLAQFLRALAYLWAVSKMGFVFLVGFDLLSDAIVITRNALVG